jgi:TatA/E family protein of Tat protein translocase
LFGIGGWEFIIIAGLALLLFGPDKLPELARTVGRFMRDFKRYQDLMESTLRAEIYATEPTGEDAFKKGKEFREKVEAGEYGAAGAEDSAVAPPDEGALETADGEAAPSRPLTPAERAAQLPAGHPLAAAIAAGQDVGIDDDLDLSTLDADDLGWVPGADDAGKGVEG